MIWRLKRTTQCEKCPWRVDVDPHDIPDGYSVEKHRALVDTIAPPPGEQVAGLFERRTIRVMSCHEHGPAEEVACIGWLSNQMGPGNNIGLRVKLMDCENFRQLRTVGEQHRCFEDTLPAGGS